MSLKDDVKVLVEHWKDQKNRIEHNNALFNIYEGDLASYILSDLKSYLSDTAFQQIKFRVAPINILKRMIDKLSQLYTKPPIREVVSGVGSDASKKDEDLVQYYVDSMDLNTYGGLANDFFNLFKYTWLEPYVDEGTPRIRVIPSDKFFVWSSNIVNPLKPTHFVKIVKKYKRPDGQERVLFYGYTDEEFLIFNDKEEIEYDLMAQVYANSPEEFGKNPYGTLPGVYINRSRFDLIPQIDTDTLSMTKIIPILLSDVNFATMFQAFSIIYGVDLDDENLSMSPNAFWRFKSDPNNPESKPSVGVIKPEADVDKVLNLIYAQLSMWLNSRNIRPGTIGAIDVQNYASGISKAIDEMDTSEDRQDQIPYFKHAESELWSKIINNFHPVWLGLPEFDNKVAFSRGVKVITNFAEQRPMFDRSKLIDDELKLIDAGLESRAGALKVINPDWTDDQVEAKLAEVEAEDADAEGSQEDGEPGSSGSDEESTNAS